MNNLNKIRKEKGISQVALSIKLGVSQETISAYENGKAYPSVDTLIKLCDIFNVSADFLLDKTDVRFTTADFCDKNLTAEEMELLGNFRKLPPLKRSRAIGLIIGMSEE